MSRAWRAGGKIEDSGLFLSSKLDDESDGFRLVVRAGGCAASGGENKQFSQEIEQWPSPGEQTR